MKNILNILSFVCMFSCGACSMMIKPWEAIQMALP